MAMHPILHNSDDLAWMRRALHLAREMLGHVWPNPPVGCVIVKNQGVVAEAATHPGGRPHAERKALDNAGAEARGATLYVTLEPCCHWGKTPPCTDAIIDAGISSVVCAVRDPDPRVNGKGFARLKKAGVAVSVGTCAEEAEQLMSGFFNRIQHGKPELIVVEQAANAPPIGIDALLVSSRQGLRLLTNPGEINVSGIEPDRLLVHLGSIGLTTIAVNDRDPFLSVLRGASV